MHLQKRGPVNNLHTKVVDEEGSMPWLGSPVIHNYLFCLVDIQDQVVVHLTTAAPPKPIHCFCE